MNGPYGGRRARLIRQSLWQAAEDILTELHWLDPVVSEGGTRRHLPIELVWKRKEPSEVIHPNAVGLTLFLTDHEEAELGSTDTIDSIPFSFDVFAEGDSLGLELSEDLRAGLAGQFPTIGRTSPTLDVYDWSMATPDRIFGCVIERLRRDQAHGFSDYRRYWYTVEGTIEDDHT